MSEVIRIESFEDPRIADYHNVRDADLRGGGGRAPRGERPNRLCMVESEPVIRRLLGAPMWRARIKSLYLSPARLHSCEHLLESIEHGPPIYLSDEFLMRAVAGYRHHGGALAAVHRPSDDEMRPQNALSPLAGRDRITLIIAERITHVDNVGSILRNASAFGADGVIFNGDCADPLFRRAIRVSMGHVFNIPWAVSETWHDELAWLRRDLDVALIGAEAAPGALPLPLDRWPDRMAIIVGNEGYGLSAASLDVCDSIILIPMREGVPSINVAAACAVVLYEIQRSSGTEE